MIVFQSIIPTFRFYCTLVSRHIPESWRHYRQTLSISFVSRSLLSSITRRDAIVVKTDFSISISMTKTTTEKLITQDITIKKEIRFLWDNPFLHFFPFNLNYSKTWAYDHHRITTTCPLRPQFLGFILTKTTCKQRPLFEGPNTRIFWVEKWIGKKGYYRVCQELWPS